MESAKKKRTNVAVLNYKLCRKADNYAEKPTITRLARTGERLEQELPEAFSTNG